jgi:uncharacterized membrane protein YbhN (UPF0104 family)
MTMLQAHLLCIAVVGVDYCARTWRMQWLMQGLGHRLPFMEVFTQTAVGEAASSLTPLRLGGEPARVWAMGRAGVKVTPAIVGIGVEIIAMTPVIILIALVMMVFFAPEWWDEVGPSLSSAAQRGWPWIVAVGIVTALAAWLGYRLAPAGAKALRREIIAARIYARRMPRWPFWASVPMTAINVAGRVAILPILVSTLEDPVSLWASAMGSFTLLYSQLFLPTPSGAGAVELGFLGGAAGDFGEDVAPLLLIWRFYTVGIGVLLGGGLAIWRYGGRNVAASVKGRR